MEDERGMLERMGERTVRLVVLALVVGCSLLVLLTTDGTVPPLLLVLPMFTAAVYLSVRDTAVAAVVCASLLGVLAWFDEGYREWGFGSRLVIAMTCGAVATLMAAARVRREHLLRRTSADLLLSQLFRGVVDSTPDPVYVKDPEGRYLVANAAAARLVGREDPSELIGHRDRELVDEQRAAVVEREDRRALEHGDRIESEDVLHGPDGPMVLLTHRAVVRDDDGRVIGVSVIGRDITARQRAEEELRKVVEARSLVADAASRAALAVGRAGVAEAVLDVLAERLPPHLASVALRTEDDRVPIPFAMRGMGSWEGWRQLPPDLDLPFRDVIATGVRRSFADRAEALAAYPDLQPIMEEVGLWGQVFVIPLTAGNRTIGALTLAYHQVVDADLLDATRIALDKLAPVLAASVVQAELQERGAQIASSFQQSMLELALQADPRLALSVHYQAGTAQMEAGGDWYDVIPLPDGRIAIVVGDVVGRSLRAATVMGRLRGACRGLLLAAADPAVALGHLDDVSETIDGARYATCCCLIVDPSARSIVYSSAGHPPPLVLWGEGESRFLLDAQGPPLAVDTGATRPTATVEFNVGSRLVVYTDGLVERRDEVLDVGLERLRAVACDGWDGFVDDECDRITEVMFDGVEQQDDVALVCAELISHATHELARQFHPEPRALARLRHDLRLWLTGNRLPADPIETVLLAVGEALANAVEHAGAEGVDLRVHRLARRRYRATIADTGHWHEGESDPTRGRGLAIMQALAEEVHIDRSAAGTTVVLDFSF